MDQVIHESSVDRVVSRGPKPKTAQEDTARLFRDEHSTFLKNASAFKTAKVRKVELYALPVAELLLRRWPHAPQRHAADAGLVSVLVHGFLAIHREARRI